MTSKFYPNERLVSNVWFAKTKAEAYKAMEEIAELAGNRTIVMPEMDKKPLAQLVMYDYEVEIILDTAFDTLRARAMEQLRKKHVRPGKKRFADHKKQRQSIAA